MLLNGKYVRIFYVNDYKKKELMNKLLIANYKNSLLLMTCRVNNARIKKNSKKIFNLIKIDARSSLSLNNYLAKMFNKN